MNEIAAREREVRSHHYGFGSCPQIKSVEHSPSDWGAKYNQPLSIEEESGGRAQHPERAAIFNLRIRSSCQ